MNRLILLLIMSICIACGGNGQKTKNVATAETVHIDSLYRIDLQQKIDNDSILTINDLAQDTRFIALELKRESTLSPLNFRMDKIGRKLIASSFNTPVFQFDTLGRYEDEVVSFGRAKNDLNKSIYRSIFSNGQLTFNQGQKVIVLTPNSVVGYVAKRYYFSVIPLIDGGYVTLPNLGDEIKNEKLMDFLDDDFKYVESVKSKTLRDLYYTLPQGYNGRLETFTLSSSHNGGALFRRIFSDTVQLVTSSKKIDPYIKLEYGDLMPDIDDITNQEKIHIRGIAENQYFIFIKYGYKSSVYSMIWDKRKRSTLISSKIDYSDNNSLINSTFFTDYTTSKGDTIKVGIAGISSTSLYCVIKTLDAIKFMNDVDFEDNPLIMEIKLR